MRGSPAYAQSLGGGLGGLGPLLPLILIFVVFYFLLIRPQQKNQKTHREMLGSLRRGDRIVTSGGLIGKITKVPGDSQLIVEIADGIKVRIMRAMVADLLSKPQPVRSRVVEEEDVDEDEDDYEDGDDDGLEDEEEETETRR